MTDTPRTDYYRSEFRRRKGTGDLIEWMLDEFEQAERRLAAKQAEVDRLMLEYCPDEMTPEQRTRWEASQRPAAPHRKNTYAGMPRHTDSCAVHSPTLRPCSCELETKLKDIITQLRADLKLGVEFGKWKAAPQPSTADFKAAPSQEGVGQGDAAVAATERGELIKQIQERARIRRQIPTRKSVQEGQPDRIADLLERAAAALSRDSEDAERLDWWARNPGADHHVIVDAPGDGDVMLYWDDLITYKRNAAQGKDLRTAIDVARGRNP